MMPDGVLSTTSAPARFLGSRGLPTSKIIDYEDGGIALSDPSKGLLYQRWTAKLINAGEPDSYVTLEAENLAPFTLIALPDLTEISIAFDQLMRPTLTYVQSGTAYIRWYDSADAAYVTDLIGAGIITPRVSMDDKRYVATDGYQTNDVILGYIKGGDLYYRQQRDRFEVEYLLKTSVKPLIKIGFNRGLRFQFMSEV